MQSTIILGFLDIFGLMPIFGTLGRVVSTLYFNRNTSHSRWLGNKDSKRATELVRL
jgi:hypothetical protein